MATQYFCQYLSIGIQHGCAGDTLRPAPVLKSARPRHQALTRPRDDDHACERRQVVSRYRYPQTQSLRHASSACRHWHQECDGASPEHWNAAQGRRDALSASTLKDESARRKDHCRQHAGGPDAFGRHLSRRHRQHGAVGYRYDAARQLPQLDRRARSRHRAKCAHHVAHVHAPRQTRFTGEGADGIDGGVVRNRVYCWAGSAILAHASKCSLRRGVTHCAR